MSMGHRRIIRVDANIAGPDYYVPEYNGATIMVDSSDGSIDVFLPRSKRVLGYVFNIIKASGDNSVVLKCTHSEDRVNSSPNLTAVDLFATITVCATGNGEYVVLSSRLNWAAPD